MPAHVSAARDSRPGTTASKASAPSVAATTTPANAAGWPQLRSINRNHGTRASNPQAAGTISSDISQGGSAQQPSSRPVYKMRRTGHTGSFSFPARPTGTPSTANSAKTANAPSVSLASPLPGQSRPSENGSGFSKALPEQAEQPRVAESMPAPATTSSLQRNHDSEVADTVEELDSDSDDSTGKNQDASVDGSGATIDAPASPVPVGPNSGTPKTTSPTMYPYSLESALDDQEYKSFIDDDGQALATCGALIPRGYKKSNVPGVPWICPIRSCRKLVASLFGLGRHSCNAHRAACLNDNLDGTLTFLGTYADPLPGNGKYSGGNAKRAIVVSKGPLSVIDAPAVEPSLIGSVQRAQSRRGGHLQDELSHESTARGPFMALADIQMPQKYQPDTSYGGRPWICPIRSCRLLYGKKASLAYHLNHSHQNDEVNDNGDGTYSVTGKHNQTGNPGGLKLKVVSRNPPDPNEHPMAEPRISDSSHRPELAKPAQDNRSTPKGTSKSGSDLAIQGLWAHICTRLGRKIPIPTDSHLRYLLSRPQVRDLELDPDKISAQLDLRQLTSLIIQVIGDVRERGCTTCRRGASPFLNCVRLSHMDAFKVADFLRGGKHSCANCLIKNTPHSCSIKSKPVAVLEGAIEDGDGEGGDVERRKSSRLSVMKLVGDDEGEDGDREEDEPPRQLRRRRRREEVDAENHEDGERVEPEHKRRLVAMRLSGGARGQFLNDADIRSASATRSASQPSGRSERVANFSRPERSARGLQIEQNSLETEEWEHGEGIINGNAADASSRSLAFSQSYLSANQSIQISDKIGFSTTIVTSGASHQFVADTAKTRLCTLGSGKLRVQVDGEPEFVIGFGGMFSISPGVACLVLNRGYADAVMQVTSLANH
ncbi:hypothetical protein B0T25DRAFT_549026 [Lasiosphaeria hispida]|uniref:C2H2-type domain-containing protein n=1 Tax=Lasiosphaeria hispida TaxID=260671 RepID=A0AAJ0MD21_9PEZI|nr:hypothetical protein B0T25DRAFT_549026 [Lasiosphaeria hispida]